MLLNFKMIYESETNLKELDTLTSLKSLKRAVYLQFHVLKPSHATKAMLTQYQSKILPVENLRKTYCLHGTVSFFFFCTKISSVYTDTGCLRSHSEPAVIFLAIYHVNMRRPILFSVMTPKRKAADDEENDSNDTEKYFTWTDEEVSLLLQIATAYKNEKINEGKDWESIKSRYEDIQLKLFS